ncbi:DUF7312 domain-containing protein [Halopenitus persicus]|uniref:DUF7312 domain-containing protein n=1 Tax=Halopenitus persicus TaxID=1048396 RepID=A0A1H3IBN7_9EURY|nr:hypothetical protein [Halopenitus persicus]QHS17052.1 hypothetical protein GWK26_07775 [haloarchaeon 3A1-DGR]SDY25166.1 hypothetical protein SAMN05216564_10464 [Halopenitus persicus]
MSRSDGGRGHASSAAEEGDDPGEETEWRFGIDDVGPDGIVEETSPADEPIEPESIEPLHAVFVALGIVLTVGLLATAL